MKKLSNSSDKIKVQLDIPLEFDLVECMFNIRAITIITGMVSEGLFGYNIYLNNLYGDVNPEDDVNILGFLSSGSGFGCARDAKENGIRYMGV